MEVALVKLTDLRHEQRASNDRDAFQRSYPGAFLLAMGFLSAEVIRARAPTGRSTLAAEKQRADQTTALSFGPRLRHEADASHPLAGFAFFLRPSDDRNSLLIGRGQHCDITVPEKSTSDEHCRIEITNRGVVAIDIGSTNGTSINLVRLEPNQPAVLADEDVLTIGRYSFQLMTSDTMYSELQLLNEFEGDA